MSESSKYRHLTRPYCYRADGEPGCGIDLASQGDPVVPWAWQLELPYKEFSIYNSGHQPMGPIQLRGFAEHIPVVCDNSLDFLFSSHWIEDVLHWEPVLKEWTRVLKPGGKLIILLPDKERWQAAIKRGQPPNCAHRHESFPGELSTYASNLGLKVIEDRLTDLTPEDYTILFVAEKL